MSLQQQLKRVNDFFSNYKVESIRDDAVALHSSKLSFLVITHPLPKNQSQLNSIHQLLEHHLSFSQHYLLKLHHFQVYFHGKDGFIRAIYEYGQATLKREIQTRANTNQPFSEDQIWIIILSVVDSLLYLQKQGVAYGILGCDQIFLDSKIRLIDPSAIAIDPLKIDANRLQSPQIRSGEQEIDVLKSDVYVLGLCILETALLINLSDCPLKQIQNLLNQLQECYSEHLIHLVTYLLKLNPSDRPSFEDIKEFIETELLLKQEDDNHCVQPLVNDEEDNPSLENNIFEEQYEYVDALAENGNRNIVQPTEYQKAKIKFIGSKENYPFNNMPLIEKTMEMNSNYEKQQEFKETRYKQIRESKGLNRAKQIKSRKTSTAKTISSISIEFKEPQYTKPEIFKFIRQHLPISKQNMHQTHDRSRSQISIVNYPK